MSSSNITDLLAKLWDEVLGEKPTADTDFFAAGGDSVLAARLTSRVKREVSKSVRISLIFEKHRFVDYVQAVEESSRN